MLHCSTRGMMDPKDKAAQAPPAAAERNSPPAPAAISSAGDNASGPPKAAEAYKAKPPAPEAAAMMPPEHRDEPLAAPKRPAIEPTQNASNPAALQTAKPPELTTPPVRQDSVGAQNTQKKEDDVNTINNDAALKLATGSWTQWMGAVPEDATKNLQAMSNSISAGYKAFEQLRTDTLASSAKALECQLAHTAALAKAKSLQEALELQQQFGRAALAAYASNSTAFAKSLTVAWSAAFAPLAERYKEVTPKA
jgi:hypothetical protein